MWIPNLVSHWAFNSDPDPMLDLDWDPETYRVHSLLKKSQPPHMLHRPGAQQPCTQPYGLRKPSHQLYLFSRTADACQACQVGQKNGQPGYSQPAHPLALHASLTDVAHFLAFATEITLILHKYAYARKKEGLNSKVFPFYDQAKETSD